MEKNVLKAIEAIKEVRTTSWNFEKKDILKKVVKEFRDEGLSDAEIKKLFENVLIKEQDNSVMISNNSDYLDLLNDILNN
jgi:hypothetical protein